MLNIHNEFLSTDGELDRTPLQFINTIYRATEGEGIYLGRPQVFVRYQGCNVGCVNCDSKETWDFNSTPNETTESIIHKVLFESANHNHHNLSWVSITGGDPLHPKLIPGVLDLTQKLKSLGKKINIEAAGTRVVIPLFDAVDFISFDYKTPSTQVETSLKNIIKVCELYGHKTQIKAVITDERDFFRYLHIFHQVKNYFEQTLCKELQVPFVVTPCFIPEEQFPLERFLKIISLNEDHGGFFRVIGQQHKWLHGPNQKNV